MKLLNKYNTLDDKVDDEVSSIQKKIEDGTYLTYGLLVTIFGMAELYNSLHGNSNDFWEYWKLTTASVGGLLSYYITSKVAKYFIKKK